MLAFPDVCFDCGFPLRSPEPRATRVVALEVLGSMFVKPTQQRPRRKVFLSSLHWSLLEMLVTASASNIYRPASFDGILSFCVLYPYIEDEDKVECVSRIAELIKQVYHRVSSMAYFKEIIVILSMATRVILMKRYAGVCPTVHTGCHVVWTLPMVNRIYSVKVPVLSD